LIAGSTGSGKSVCISGMLAGFLLQSTPDDLHVSLVDPKRVELSGFAGVPHLRDDEDRPRRIIVEPEEAVSALQALAVEMDRRYMRLAEAGVRNIDAFRAAGHHLATDVMIVDEWADLIMTAPDVEDVAVRIGQLGRAAGVHLVLATQSPRAEVLPGLLKTNLPAHFAFAVSSGVDSSVILDERGAEKLMGRGDMLCRIGGSGLRRLQGTYVSDGELSRLIGHWRGQRRG
jgi:S-DNA-T family DNA segregation ATPase FtsK/SpoIIIE